MIATALAIPAVLLLLFGLYDWAIPLVCASTGFSLISLHSVKRDSRALTEYLYQLSQGGDHHVEHWVHGPLRDLQEPIVEMLREKNRQQDLMRSVVKEIGYSSKELTDNATRAATLSRQQSEATYLSSTATSEISQSIHEITSRIDTTMDAAQHSKELCEQGYHALMDTRQEVNNVTKLANETGDHIQSLDENLEMVLSMSNIIREIAEQTNLLSLNAAIEAARAGEYGRGFAVVADEVRSLAQRSHDSAHAITEKTSNVNLSMKQVGECMSQVVQNAETCQTSVTTTLESLEKILDTSDNITREITVVATASEQQAAAASEISTNITNIAATAKDSAQMAEQTAQVSGHIYKLANTSESTA
jgi:methyl-accepting chemotaxis protein